MLSSVSFPLLLSMVSFYPNQSSDENLDHFSGFKIMNFKKGKILLHVRMVLFAFQVLSLGLIPKQ